LEINELLNKARAGDLKSEARLFEYLTARFRYFIKRNIWDNEDCEDIVQEALLTISARYKDIDFTVSFIGWAHRVLQNKIMNFHSKKKRQSGLMQKFEKLSEHSDRYEIDVDFELQLIKCINELNKKNNRFARAVNFTYQGFTVDEICRRLNVTKTNFYSVLSRARSLLLMCLKKGNFEG
jgi:RNA polymerase sigma factor (sigma-70 family)